MTGQVVGQLLLTFATDHFEHEMLMRGAVDEVVSCVSQGLKTG